MAGRRTLRDRFRGCLLGVAAGDALGAPFEGFPRVEARAVEAWARATEPLRWTDDTHMTLALARSLLDRRGVDPAHVAAQFVRDHQAEPWRGYGPGPPRVFAALAGGAAWDEPARQLFDGQGSYGNGAAMRVAPVGLLEHRDTDALVAAAREVARITHAHELGQQAAALQAAAVGRLATAEPAQPSDAGELLAHLRRVAPAREFQQQLDRVTVARDWPVERVVAEIGNGLSGVEAVPAALHAFLRTPLSLPGTITYAVCLGGDTDTVASMAGALAGAFLGEASLPAPWRERLEAASHIVELADGLADLSEQRAR